MKEETVIKLAIISCWIFFLLEIILDFWFTSRYSGYSQRTFSISRLGQRGSPITTYVIFWGFAFSVLLIIYAVGFKMAFSNNRWATLATIGLVMYALGEGVGSSLLPLDIKGAPITMSGHLHNIVSGIGDCGLVLFSVLLLCIFPKEAYPAFNLWLQALLGVAMCLVVVFLSVAIFKPDGFIAENKGLWQRAYVLILHTILIMVTFKMNK